MSFGFCARWRVIADPSPRRRCCRRIVLCSVSVPSCRCRRAFSSMGFCVANTRNGRTSRYVSPSTVTWDSCIASSSADWVFGDARLTSSTSRRLRIPARAEAERPVVLLVDVHACDVGREQVGCELHSREIQLERAAERLREHGLPTPGTSSMSTCPSARRQRSGMRRVSAGRGSRSPDLRRPGRRDRLPHRWPEAGGWWPGSITPLLEQALDLVEYLASHRAPSTPSARELAAARRADLVVRLVEPDVGPPDVVVDDEITFLSVEHRALALESVLPALGAERDQHLAVTPRRRRVRGQRPRRAEVDRPGLVVLRSLCRRGPPPGGSRRPQRP